ncbi:MAG: ATP-binding protein, partial [Acidobacteriota bacterium]
MTRAWLAWSSGKDSAWALHGSHLEIGGDLEIVGLFTTIDEASSRVGMHHVHRRLVEAQAEAVGLPLRIVELPWP